MNGMFWGTAFFNQDISGWDTGAVTDMGYMFQFADSFNQNIGSWNTAKVADMSFMFAGASAFDQNLGSWEVGALADATEMFDGIALSTANYDALLIGWNAQNLQNGVTFDGGNSHYCQGKAARSHMISSDGWTITDGGTECLVYLPLVIR